MLRNWSTFVLLLLLTPVLVLAQSTGKLAGQVIDQDTGEPLPGASVALLGTQSGTISDVDGNYFIIGVPVGIFDVQASFVGFQTQTVQGVEINAGYTREINFSLKEGIQLAEIVVEYERPLIQKDAIGAPRVVTGEDIENLPVRGIAAVTQVQAGVVSNEGSNNLFIRGGREQEVSFYVDGVKVIGLAGVPQQAIQEQEMLLGSIPARYGDAMSGIISITTKTGGRTDYFGSVEALTSEVLDDYGYNLFSGSFGGPIAKNKLSFFLSAEGIFQSDSDPYARNTFQLRDNLYNDMLLNPQVLTGTNSEGNTVFVPFPAEQAAAFFADPANAGEALTPDQVHTWLEEAGLAFGDTGVSLNSDLTRDRAETFTSSDFVRRAGKDEPQQDLQFNGNITITPTDNINVRIGGNVAMQEAETFNYARSLFNRDRFYNQDRDTWRAYVAWRQYLSNATFYELRADFSDDRFWQYPDNFSKNVEDVLFYGDVDGVLFDDQGNITGQTVAFDTYAAARNFYNFTDVTAVGATGEYVPKYNDENAPGGQGVYGLWSLPSGALGTYDKWHNRQFRLSANATTQVGVHQIEFGGEYEQRTNRRFRIIGSGQLANLFDDGAPESAADASAAYGDVPFNRVRSLYSNGNVYGYDFRGINESSGDTGSLDNFGTEGGSIAPHKPIYYAGYIQDKIEYRDVVLNVGVRVDVFDNNTLAIKDPYAIRPILRVADATGVTHPSNMGSDFAVYFADGDATAGVIGYRDTAGQFYNNFGERLTDPEDVTLPEVGPRGAPAVNSSAPLSSIFEDYEPQVTFMPRIGVSFPITDQALFFASYNVTSQRASERAFIPSQEYTFLGTNARVPNANLKPEVTTQYELGFRQRLGERAALQISGFYRAQKNKIQVRTMNQAFPGPYSSFFNVDFTTTKGATFEFDLRRTNNVSLNANYTLSFAQGTGSDSQTAGTIAWRGTYFPDIIAPSTFDQRHAVNISMDYRLGKGEGPVVGGTNLLENFGVNVIATLGSGKPYTRLRPPNEPIFNATNATVAGAVNDNYTPSTALVSLRVDRRFTLSNDASLTAFVWVQNLLDRDNVLGVYRASGLEDDDGYLSREAGQNAQALETNPESFGFLYSEYVGNPGPSITNNFAGTRALGLPRQVRLGVRINF